MRRDFAVFVRGTGLEAARRRSNRDLFSNKSRERDKDDGFVVFLGMKRSEGGGKLLKSPAASLCERLV